MYSTALGVCGLSQPQTPSAVRVHPRFADRGAFAGELYTYVDLCIYIHININICIGFTRL